MKILIPILVLLLPIIHFVNYRQSKIIVLKRFIFLLIGYAITKWFIYLEVLNKDITRNLVINILQFLNLFLSVGFTVKLLETK